MQRSALCRSRRELSDAYLLAKIGFDTAENEPFQVCPLSAYRSPRYRALDLPAVKWLEDFKQRVEQLRASPKELWFGGLFFPEAYLTAMKQVIAEKNGWSTELKGSIGEGPNQTNYSDRSSV